MKFFVLAFVAAVGFGQSFEVASIRPHTGPNIMLGTQIDGSLVKSSAMAVHDLITYAYELKTYQVSGVPSGIVAAKERYDISARVPGDSRPPVAQVRRMYQALLAERFQLQFHREMRDMDVYALVPAKSGPKLREPSDARSMLLMKGNSIMSTAAPMSMFAGWLGGQQGIDRPVIDKTGLAAKYDFQLNFVLDAKERQMTGPGGESIFTAIEEQLGLKLEKQKASIEVLVVDSVQKPSEN